jgi:hypothetical protein
MKAIRSPILASRFFSARTERIDGMVFSFLYLAFRKGVTPCASPPVPPLWDLVRFDFLQ